MGGGRGEDAAPGARGDRRSPTGRRGFGWWRSATRQPLIYIACTPRVGYDTREVALDEFVEVRWLNPTQVHELMPDLSDAVREHLDGQ